MSSKQGKSNYSKKLEKKYDFVWDEVPEEPAKKAVKPSYWNDSFGRWPPYIIPAHKKHLFGSADSGFSCALRTINGFMKYKTKDDCWELICGILDHTLAEKGQPIFFTVLDNKAQAQLLDLCRWVPYFRELAVAKSNHGDYSAHVFVSELYETGENHYDGRGVEASNSDSDSESGEVFAAEEGGLEADPA